MEKRILQVNFKLSEGLDLSSPEGQQTIEEWVKHAAEFPGLEWKIWIRNEETGELGGIYLFEDAQSLEKYLNSDNMARIRTMNDVSIKAFEIEEKLTKITQGPVE